MKKTVLACMLATLPVGSLAADFDGSKKLVCAVQQAIECNRLGACEAGLPETILLPDFFNLDLKKKHISAERFGEAVSDSSIQTIQKLEDRIVFLGAGDNRGWSGVLDKATGRLTMSASENGYSFILFGACHAL